MAVGDGCIELGRFVLGEGSWEETLETTFCEGSELDFSRRWVVGDRIGLIMEEDGGVDEGRNVWLLVAGLSFGGTSRRRRMFGKFLWIIPLWSATKFR